MNTPSATRRARPASLGLARSGKADFLLLVSAAVLLTGAGLGLRDPWPADEPRFALIARDMVHSGQWLIPRIGGELYADKPPLFMWLTAALYRVTGEMRISFLLPSFLAGLGMLAAVHDLAARLWNRRVALAAGLLLLATLQFTLQARTAQLDALLALWSTLGLYGMLRHLLLGPDWRWYAAGGFAMGLGVITKGVGFLPLLVMLPWAWLHWRHPDAVPRIGGSWGQWLLAPAAMLVPIACWLVPMMLAVLSSGDPALAAYRDELLFRQTVTRYADTWTHLRPAWYFIAEVIPWAWFPVTLALPWLLPAWQRRLARLDARYWLLLGFVVCVVAFFSFSPGKRGVYILPALPALVLAAAPLAAGVCRRPAFRALCVGALALLGLGAEAVAATIAWGSETGAHITRLGYSPGASAVIAGLLGLVALALAVAGRVTRREPAALALLLATGWLMLGWIGYPVLNGARSAAGMMADVTQIAPYPGPLAMVGWKEQFLLQIDRPVVHFGYRREPAAELRDAVAWLATVPEGRLLIAVGQMAPCLDPERARRVAFRHGSEWMLAGPEAMTGACAEVKVKRGHKVYDPRLGTALPAAAARVAHRALSLHHHALPRSCPLKEARHARCPRHLV